MSTPEDLPTLRGKRVVLRPPLPEELNSLALAIASDPQTSAWWSTSAATILDDWFSGPNYHVLVVESRDVPIGVIAFGEETTPEYRSAGIDIALLSPWIGGGLGTEALRVLASWLFDERGHHRLTIDPALTNGRAIRAYEKVGFKRIGVARQYERGADGSWHDNLLMDMLEGDFLEAMSR